MQARELPFTELLSHIADNRGRTCPTAETGRPLIATNCISNNQLYPSYDTARYVSEETYRTWFRAHPLPGDIIFVCKGSPGRVALAPDPVDFCIAQDMVAVRADEGRVYPKYLFAALRSPLVQDRISNMQVGTLIPHFKKGDFNKLQIPVPERAVQEYIGDTYFELSKKIEQNRRTSRTLEELARTTFKAWFVDFEPVRAKGAGQTAFPGMSSTAFAALPVRLVKSSLGEVPHGWPISSIGTELPTFLGGTPSRARPEFWADGIVPWINSGEVNKFPIIDATALITPDAIDSSSTKIIPARSTVIAITGATLGQVSLLGIEACTNQSIVSIVGSRKLPTDFVYFWIKQNVELLLTASTGAAQQHVNKNDVNSLPVLCPHSSVMSDYVSIVAPLIDTVLHLAFESRKLEALRDYLLPRLLSGQVRAGTEGEE